MSLGIGAILFIYGNVRNNEAISHLCAIPLQASASESLAIEGVACAAEVNSWFRRGSSRIQIRVHGRIRNPGPVPCGRVMLDVEMLDDQSRALPCGPTGVLFQEIEPGGSRDFETLAMPMTAGDVLKARSIRVKAHGIPLPAPGK